MSTLTELRAIYENRHQLARQWKEEGRRLCGYLYSYVPEELIVAAGMIPVQVTDGEDAEVHRRGKEYLEDFYCDFASSCIGQGVTGAYAYLEGIVFSDACETARTVAALWKMYGSSPFFHFFTTCSENNAASREFFRGELLDFKAALEQFIGRPIEEEAIHDAIRVYNDNRALLKQLYALRNGDRPAISARETFDVVRAGLVMPKEEHSRLLRQLLAEVNGDRRSTGHGPRLLISCLTFEDTISEKCDIVSMIEELGGNIVMDDLCMGARCLWDAVAAEADWLGGLVQRYVASVPGAFKYPCDRRAEELLRLARDSQVDGAIFIIPRYCTPYLWEYPYLRSQFEEHGIPTLMLESVESMALLSVRTRLEAFLEMLVAA